MILRGLLVILISISLAGFAYSLFFQIEKLKKEISEWKWIIISELILFLWYKEINKDKSLEEILFLMSSTLMALGIKFFFENREYFTEKITELINYLFLFYTKYAGSIKLTQNLESRKRLIFARVHLCSSSLIQWIQFERQEILLQQGKKERYQKARELLWGSHPKSIDNYLVKKLGWGSMYDIEKRLRLTDEDYEELLNRSQWVEKFIKKDLERGTEWEGEFDKRFPKLYEREEENWKNYEIIKQIRNEKPLVN